MIENLNVWVDGFKRNGIWFWTLLEHGDPEKGVSRSLTLPLREKESHVRLKRIEYYIGNRDVSSILQNPSWKDEQKTYGAPQVILFGFTPQELSELLQERNLQNWFVKNPAQDKVEIIFVLVPELERADVIEILDDDDLQPMINTFFQKVNQLPGYEGYTAEKNLIRTEKDTKESVLSFLGNFLKQKTSTVLPVRENITPLSKDFSEIKTTEDSRSTEIKSNTGLKFLVFVFAIIFIAAIVSAGLSVGDVIDISKYVFGFLGDYVSPFIPMFIVAGVSLMGALASALYIYFQNPDAPSTHADQPKDVIAQILVESPVPEWTDFDPKNFTQQHTNETRPVKGFRVKITSEQVDGTIYKRTYPAGSEFRAENWLIIQNTVFLGLRTYHGDLVHVALSQCQFDKNYDPKNIEWHPSKSHSITSQSSPASSSVESSVGHNVNLPLMLQF